MENVLIESYDGDIIFRICVSYIDSYSYALQKETTYMQIIELGIKRKEKENFS